MQKVVIPSPGGYEKLTLQSLTLPPLKEGEILVEVKAAGVNYADCIIRWGLYESARKFVGYPITPGFEFAGIIREIGPAEKADLPWNIGQEVMGITLFGGYSTHVIVKTDQLYPIPKGFSFQEAAGFPAVFLTAYHALFQHIIFRQGAKVLIHSAAGGVGGALVQLACLAGGQVVGVVGSSHKVQEVYALGASLGSSLRPTLRTSFASSGVLKVIDKSKEDLWEEAKKVFPSGYDIILDANGVSTLKESYDHLASTGKLICYGFHSMFPKKGGKVNYFKLIKDYWKTPRFNPLKMTSANKSLIAFNLSFLFERKDLLQEAMSDLLSWCQEGVIHPLKVQEFELKDVAKAHEALESGKTVGKVVLNTSSSLS